MDVITLDLVLALLLASGVALIFSLRPTDLAQWRAR